MKRKSNQSKLTPNDTYDRIDKNVNSVILTVFHIFKKAKGRLNILNRDMKDVKMVHINYYK